MSHSARGLLRELGEQNLDETVRGRVRCVTDDHDFCDRRDANVAIQRLKIKSTRIAPQKRLSDA
jgi:hypothetical protein